jgi:hypothetical protein
VGGEEWVRGVLGGFGGFEECVGARMCVRAWMCVRVRIYVRMRARAWMYVRVQIQIQTTRFGHEPEEYATATL